jgi:hypothetical protein
MTDGMSDEPKKRSRAWIGWAAILIPALYVGSVFPAAWIFEWLAGRGFISRTGHVRQSLETVYAPIGWAMECSPGFEKLINAGLPKGSPR